MKSKITILGMTVCLLTGCASVTQTLTTTTTHPDGTVEEKQTRSRAWAIWDARNTVEKIRVSNGKTHSIGVAGLDSEASSTNLADNLRALADLLKAAR